jgi:hypothetical protein
VRNPLTDLQDVESKIPAPSGKHLSVKTISADETLATISGRPFLPPCYSHCMEWRTLTLDEWKPVSRPVALVAIAFYLLFLLYSANNRSGFLFLDLANLMIHEAGHPLFGILGGGAETGFGHTLMVLGGTLFELIVPLACVAYFFFRRESTGTAFCAFWFFENFLYIGTYMADARTSALLLVGSGDSDWEVLFTQWNLMLHDTQIAQATRTLGWLGMIASAAWFAYRAFGRSSGTEVIAVSESQPWMRS